jgi:hypothetical protein
MSEGHDMGGMKGISVLRRVTGMGIAGGPANGPPPTGEVTIRFHVTGIVEPTDPDSSFWKTDPLLAAPSLYVSQSKLWEGAVIADPGDSGVIQQIFGSQGLDIQWDLPVDTTGLHAQAPALFSQVNQVTHQIPELTGPLAPMADALSVSSGPVPGSGAAATRLRVVPAPAGCAARGHRHRAGLRDQVGTRARCCASAGMTTMRA